MRFLQNKTEKQQQKTQQVAEKSISHEIQILCGSLNRFNNKTSSIYQHTSAKYAVAEMNDCTCMLFSMWKKHSRRAHAVLWQVYPQRGEIWAHLFFGCQQPWNENIKKIEIVLGTVELRDLKEIRYWICNQLILLPPSEFRLIQRLLSFFVTVLELLTVSLHSHFFILFKWPKKKEIQIAI